MPRNPTLFTITVPITKKMMDRAIEASTYDLDDYSPEHFRAAGLNLNKIRRELANDDKFRVELGRQMVDTARQAILDAFDYSDISVNGHATIQGAVKKLDRAVDAERKQLEQDREAQRVKDATELLRSKGFKVVQG